MRSKAVVLGHPLHPILIAFPGAFIYGGFLADLFGRVFNWPTVMAAGAYLSVAAVVSPNSSAKARATNHLIVNVSALSAVVAGGLFRDWSSLAPGVGTILLEAIGVGLVSCGGYLGGTLVYRNQIAVDHRYANAGKWKEQTDQGRPGESVMVAQADELKPNQMKLLHVDGRRIVLARTDDGFAAFDDHCPHRGGSLADGVMACGTVVCPWHGSEFDVATGAVKAGPADRPIGTYRVEQAGGDVLLTVPPV
jgi:nitrite reductase/ring-hydroxylating ferredoxin subunit/uncharacterized membrane protein